MNTRNKLVLAVLALLVLGLSSAPCPPPPGVGTPGFYKKPDHWPGWIDEVTIGGVTYTKEEAIEIMKTSGRGDKTYTLFRALVAARMNQFVGNDTSCPIPGTSFTVQDIIFQANGWLMNHPLDSGVKGNSEAWQGGGEWKYKWLDAYNNGLLCAPSRDDLESD